MHFEAGKEFVGLHLNVPIRRIVLLGGHLSSFFAFSGVCGECSEVDVCLFQS